MGEEDQWTASVVNRAPDETGRTARRIANTSVHPPENLTGIHVGTECRATLRDSRGAQGLRRKLMPVTGRGSGIPSLAG